MDVCKKSRGQLVAYDRKTDGMAPKKIVFLDLDIILAMAYYLIDMFKNEANWVSNSVHWIGTGFHTYWLAGNTYFGPMGLRLIVQIKESGIEDKFMRFKLERNNYFAGMDLSEWLDSGQRPPFCSAGCSSRESYLKGKFSLLPKEAFQAIYYVFGIFYAGIGITFLVEYANKAGWLFRCVKRKRCPAVGANAVS